MGRHCSLTSGPSTRSGTLSADLADCALTSVASYWAVTTHRRQPRCMFALGSDSGDVGGEEVDAVAVEVASGGRSAGWCGVGVAGEDLCDAEWDAGVEGVGDGGVAEWVGADVSGDAGGLRDPQHHPVDVAAVDRLPRSVAGSAARRCVGPRQASRKAVCTCSVSTRRTGMVSGMVAGLLPLPTRCSTRRPRRVSA